MGRVIERAATTGIAAAAIRGSNHCGAMGYFAAQALPHDMIGLATTQPRPPRAAFGGGAHGKIRIHHQKGLPLPEGWAMDREGRPTTDPAAAIDGLLTPIGGFKGTELAMIMGMLSSMLSGASYGTELGDMEAGPRPGGDGHFVAVIRVEAFEDVDRFKSRVDGAIRQIHACRPAAGFERIYAPGEREFLNREAYREEGIPLNGVTLADLKRAAEGMGVETEGFAWLG